MEQKASPQKDAFLVSASKMKKTVLPVRILFIEEDGFHLLIRASLNNKKAWMLIDTGASKTVFDTERIKKFVDEKEFERNDKLSTGLGTNSMQTHSGTIKKIQLGKLTLKNLKTILLDLSHVNESYDKLGLPMIDGVLGSDLMIQYNAVIDYEAKELKLKWK
jgi:predicted aspartyl protease